MLDVYAYTILNSCSKVAENLQIPSEQHEEFKGAVAPVPSRLCASYLKRGRFSRRDELPNVVGYNLFVVDELFS